MLLAVATAESWGLHWAEKMAAMSAALKAELWAATREFSWGGRWAEPMAGHLAASSARRRAVRMVPLMAAR